MEENSGAGRRRSRLCSKHMTLRSTPGQQAHLLFPNLYTDDIMTLYTFGGMCQNLRDPRLLLAGLPRMLPLTLTPNRTFLDANPNGIITSHDNRKQQELADELARQAEEELLQRRREEEAAAAAKIAREREAQVIVYYESSAVSACLSSID